MKKKLNKLLILSSVIFSLSACELFSLPKDENLTQVDEVELAKWQDAGEGTYYKSDLYEMHSTIAGYFKYGRPFTIENDNQNLHIYNNLYLYEGDEIFIAKNKARSKGSFLPDFDYCFELKEKADEEYVRIDSPEEDPTCGSLFIKEGKDGIYKVTFDVETKKIDLEYLSEIETPKYDPIDHVDIQNLHDGSNKKTTVMRPSEQNPDELCVLNYYIPMYASIIFPNALGCYTRVWLPDSYINACRTFTKRELIRFHRGGNYNVYLNRLTRDVRLELIDPETATYCCYVIFNGNGYDGTPVAMTADSTHPYIFHLDNFSNDLGDRWAMNIRFAEVEPGEPGKYKYDLTPLDDNLRKNGNDGLVFTSGGTFNITINLLEGTIAADKLA